MKKFEREMTKRVGCLGGGGGGRKQIKNQIVAFSKILSTKNDCYVKLPIISKI